ncbi:MAG: anti-anti-sigma factor [Phenylobacterium sp.]|jgi:anti-anti-sigma factor
MSGEITSIKQGGVLKISVTGMFDANVLKEFHRTYQDLEGKDKLVVVQLVDAEYMDSAGLGMLLHMKKALDKQSGGREIRLINANDRIMRLFKLMQFDQMFTIK